MLYAHINLYANGGTRRREDMFVLCFDTKIQSEVEAVMIVLGLSRQYYLMRNLDMAQDGLPVINVTPTVFIAVEGEAISAIEVAERDEARRAREIQGAYDNAEAFA